MSDAMTITTELRYDGEQAESFFDGHPAVMIEKLSGMAESLEAWSPPHLFVAAVESCFFTTMQVIAAKMHVGIRSFSSASAGTLVSPDGKHKEFSEIVLRPKIELADENDRPKLSQLYKLAEEYCVVARSLKTTVRIDAA
jgi:organic hydroperoxide reductase OsmC/OhrA